MATKVAILSVVLLGFCALAVDIGYIYDAKHELQRATDAAAVAGAAQLSRMTVDGEDAFTASRAAAKHCAVENLVAGKGLGLDTDVDVVFGRALEDESLPGAYVFEENQTPINACQVTGRRTDDSPDGPVDLFFARILGVGEQELQAQAAAFVMPRDIAMVVDLTDSHNDDSELRNYKDTHVNLHSVWNALGGGADVNPGNWPGWDADDPSALGFGWGFFKLAAAGPHPARGFGAYTVEDIEVDGETVEMITLDPEDYDPNDDPGLIHLDYNSLFLGAPRDWNPASNTDFQQLEDYLKTRTNPGTGQPYDGDYDDPTSTIGILLRDRNHGFGFPGGPGQGFNHRKWEWRYRSAVVTGYADWNDTDGDTYIDHEEIIWPPDDAPIPGVRTAATVEDPANVVTPRDLWIKYIDYANTAGFNPQATNPEFKWKLGIKTFISFLLDSHTNHEQTDFSGTPHQPAFAVKQAVRRLMEALPEGVDDYASLEVYDETARNEVVLGPVRGPGDTFPVSDRLFELQAGHYGEHTNVGSGLFRARQTFEENGREIASPVIILLSDGQANRPFGLPNDAGEIPDWISSYSGDPAVQYTLLQASLAAQEGVRIYAISVGANADQDLMQLIAELSDGVWYHAEGSIPEYSEQLVRYFEEIAVARRVTLIQ